MIYFLSHVDNSQKSIFSKFYGYIFIALFQFPDTMSCSKMDQCPTEKIFCTTQNIKFRRENTLKEIFEEFVSKDFDQEKAKRNMITHEPLFRKICQNLKLHLGSDVIETNIFKGIKAVTKRDFEKELKSEKIQIFVPQVFLSKFSHVIEYDESLKKSMSSKLFKI